MLLIVISASAYFLVGLATGSNEPPKTSQPTESSQSGEYAQPVAFSHKTHVEAGGIPCEFCHVYARRSINSGAPVLASCFGCHKVIKGSDEKKQKAIKELLEYKESGKSISWKKIHDLPDFVHFSHKRHIKVGFDCTECHGKINQHEMLSTKTMITDLSMGWCVKCHREGKETVNGKIAGPIRTTRGGTILTQAKAGQPDGIIQGSKDCYICHK